ncbi:cytochrome c oxidase assembly protein subunit 15 [Luteococcus japonicus]|uniref:Cytochrome c oxidase assembly protein subunit 15 n=2 Tax=Luteococcus japonicus TaxID=33984 RepID=A0A3N1ZV51_9ACTN|nr:cytochrome c oxidase assembly protein subunit 15 [Luteococcus japonicus]
MVMAMSTATPTIGLDERSAAGARDFPAVRLLLKLAAVFGVLTVVTGSVNSATGSGFACPTWPGCYPGHFGPEAEVHDIIEFGHRLIAASTGFILLGAAIAAFRLPRRFTMARVLPWFSVVGAILSAVLGRMVVLNGGIPMPLAMIDLLGALTVLMAATLAYMSMHRGAPRWQWTPLSRLAAGIMASIVVLHLLGIVVSGKGSFTAVVGWPMWRLVSQDGAIWLQVLRMALAAGIVVSMALLTRRSWHLPTVRPVMITMLALCAVEFVLGQVLAVEGVDMWWAAGHCAAACLMLLCISVVSGRTALDGL